MKISYVETNDPNLKYADKKDQDLIKAIAYGSKIGDYYRNRSDYEAYTELSAQFWLDTAEDK